MKKVWLALVAATLLTAAVLVAFPAIREEMAWKLASYNARPESFVTYIAAWPNGKHTDEARALLDEKVWERQPPKIRLNPMTSI